MEKAEAVAVDCYNEYARRLVAAITGWDAVPGRGQFFRGAALFTGWREDQASRDLVGAWYCWSRTSDNGRCAEVRVSVGANLEIHRQILREGYDRLMAAGQKNLHDAMVSNG